MTTVTVIGAGYVGLTTAACLAHLGHRVRSFDVDTSHVRRLKSGRVKLLEPGLSEMVHRHQRTGQLSFTHTAASCLAESAVVILCLPTPARPDGTADLTAIEATVPLLRRHLSPGSRLILKSTVPPGTHRRLTAALDRGDITVISNPEFLREGNAVHDWLHPDRIVLGADDPEHARHAAALYQDLDAPVVITDATSAELIKYAANTFLALKITYANTLAELCEQLGANPTDVRTGLGHDTRIGTAYLTPGPGWGGPCLPKDTRALLALGNDTTADLSLIEAIVRTNAHHQRRVLTLLENLLPRPLPGARISVLGLTFKPGTNDLRDSPALSITTALAARHAHITAYDPGITGTVPRLTDHLVHAHDPATALAGCDAALLLTDWPQFATLPWRRLAPTMRGTLVLDTRGQLDPTDLAGSGLRLHTLGHATANQPMVETA